MRKIMRLEGWRAFYSGLMPAVVGSAFAWGSYFYLYEGIKKEYCKWVAQLVPCPGELPLLQCQSSATSVDQF